MTPARPILVASLMAVTLALASSGDAAIRRRPVTRPSELAAKIDVVAATYLQRPLPGFTVGVMQQGRITFDKGYGYSNIAQSTPAWSGTPYQVGSVTKQFTAAAILVLRDGGKLSLDDDILVWVPEFPSRGSRITLRQLLNHTSGIPNYTSYLTDPYTPLTPSQIFALIADKPIEFQPGVSWSYNNTGYYLLGLVIERASGMPYAQFLASNFFRPLGLTASSYCGIAPNAQVPSGYIDVLPSSMMAVDPANMSLVYAAGGICSTTGDLLRWTDALHHGRVLSAASYAEMLAPTRLPGGRVIGYGFGLGVGTDRSGRRYAEHGGSVLGFQSYVGYYLDTDTTIVTLVPLTPLRGAPASDLANEVIKIVLPVSATGTMQVAE